MVSTTSRARSIESTSARSIGCQKRYALQATNTVLTRLELEDKEFDDLEQRFIKASVREGGEFAFGEPVERYEAVDPETGDMLVMFRAPYRSTEEGSASGTA